MFNFKKIKLFFFTILLLSLIGFTAEQQKPDITGNGELILAGVISTLPVLPAVYKPGEPVAGAEIFVELEEDNTVMLKGKTDHLGTYHFKNLKKGTYKIVITLPGKASDWTKKAEEAKPSKLYINFILDGIKKSPFTLGSKTGKKAMQFESPAFTVTNELNSFNTTVQTAVNNYGINDEGIK